MTVTCQPGNIIVRSWAPSFGRCEDRPVLSPRRRATMASPDLRESSSVATRRRALSQAYDSRRGVGNLVEGEFFVWLERAFSFIFCLIDYYL